MDKPIQCEYCKKVFIEYQGNCDRCGAPLPHPLTEPKAPISNHPPFIVNKIVKPSGKNYIYPLRDKIEREKKKALFEEQSQTFFARLIIISGVLFIFAAYFYYTGSFSRVTPKFASSMPTVRKAIRTPTRIPRPSPTGTFKLTPPVPTVVPASPSGDWRWHSLALYNMQIKLPPEWTIGAYNRRPEPTNDQLDGHDCANYMISDQEQKVKLILSPACGSSEGIPGDCPQDTVMISSQKSIVRYYDANKAAYVYTKWGNPVVQSTRGNYRASYCSGPPSLVYQSGKDFTVITIDLFYLGSQDKLSDNLAIVDAIVLTLAYK